MDRRAAAFDVAVVGAVSAAYAALELAGTPKRWTYLGAAVVLAAYSVHLVRRRAPSWRDLGFRTDNLRAAAVPAALFTGGAALGIVAWGAARGAAFPLRQVALLAVLYPAWAVVQQLAFQGLLHGGLRTFTRSAVLQVVATSAAFAAVHAGDATLVALTFAAGLAWSLLHRRTPNLWVLAASHTVLAAIAYPLVVGDDPLARI